MKVSLRSLDERRPGSAACLTLAFRKQNDYLIPICLVNVKSCFAFALSVFRTHWTEAVSRGRKPWTEEIDNRGSHVDLLLIKMGIVLWSLLPPFLGPMEWEL